MASHFDKVKNYLSELGFKIASENAKQEWVVVNDEANGIKHLIVDCEAPIVVLTQYLFDIKNADGKILKRLLQMNNSLVHGAFVLDENGKRLLFKDTLELENLDRNELEGSIKALSLALVEHGSELIKFAKGN